MDIFTPTPTAPSIEHLKFVAEAALTKPPKEDLYGSVTDSGLALKKSIGLVHNTLCTVSDLEKLPDVKADHAAHETFLNTLKGVQYLEIKSMKVPAVEGLSVNYLTYIGVLHTCIEHMKRIYPDILKQYSEYLARFVSDDKTRKAHSTQTKINYEKYGKLRDANYKALVSCLKKFNPKGPHTKVDQVPLSSLVRNNGEWVQIIKKSEELVAAVIECDRTMIKQEVHTCAEYIEIVAENLHANKKADITPAAYTDVINGAFHVAEEVEFFNTIWTLVFGLSNAIGGTANSIIDRLSMR